MLNSSSSQAMAYCHKCGKEVPAESTFCPACGTPVAGTAQPASLLTRTTQPVQNIPNLATSGDRFVAVLIDHIILWVAGFIFALPIGLLGAFGAFGIGFFS